MCDTDALYATPDIAVQARAGGTLHVHSRTALADHPRTVLHSLHDWADRGPEHPFIAERTGDGGWRTLTYRGARDAALAVGQALLERGLGPQRPLLLLSGNSVDHATVLLGAMTAGVPVATTSVAYSLMSKDHDRLRAITKLVHPGAVFAEDREAFSAAVAAVARIQSDVIVLDSVADLVRSRPGTQVEAAFDALGPDGIAKLLFTSGSTGYPKAVVTTHRMLASNQQAMRQVWPFLGAERPVIVDWLPWSHTFGGSHNFNLVMTNGGTLHIDEGRPTPTHFRHTLANIAEVRPTIHFSVPAGYAQLVPALEADDTLARAFFSRLRLAFNAAAALPSNLRERLSDLSERTVGRRVPVTGSWGLTETAPAVTTAHFDYDDARSIGVPLPGAELRLVPEGDAYEIRVRGPMVTPGYYGQPELTGEATDEDGFWRTGDAVQFADPSEPAAGLLFRGRLAEDFKLSTGTFVHVGAVRTALLSAVPVLSDAVIVGHDRDEVCALAWLNRTEAITLLGREPSANADVVVDDELRHNLSARLAEHGRESGSAGRVVRLLLLTEPPDLDAGEITDKGYLNQRRIIALRSAYVERLYQPHDPAVIDSAAVPQGAAHEAD